MSETIESFAPAQQLTKMITQRLVKKGLLTHELASKNESKIAQGKMQSADWKLVFEMSLELHKGHKKG